MRPEPEQRGSALVLAMLLVVVLVTATSVITSSMLRTTTRAMQDLGQASALAAAESGIELARVRIASDPRWPGGGLNVADAAVQVEAASTSGDNRIVTASALWTRGSTRVMTTVTAELAPNPAGLPTIVRWSAGPR